MTNCQHQASKRSLTQEARPFPVALEQHVGDIVTTPEKWGAWGTTNLSKGCCKVWLLRKQQVTGSNPVVGFLLCPATS